MVCTFEAKMIQQLPLCGVFLANVKRQSELCSTVEQFSIGERVSFDTGLLPKTKLFLSSGSLLNFIFSRDDHGSDAVITVVIGPMANRVDVFNIASHSKTFRLRTILWGWEDKMRFLQPLMPLELF